MTKSIDIKSANTVCWSHFAIGHADHQLESRVIAKTCETALDLYSRGGKLLPDWQDRVQ